MALCTNLGLRDKDKLSFLVVFFVNDMVVGMR